VASAAAGTHAPSDDDDDVPGRCSPVLRLLAALGRPARLPGLLPPPRPCTWSPLLPPS
jgi:hypothetical protein